MKGRPWGSTLGAPPKSPAHFSIDSSLKEWASKADMPMSRLLEESLLCAKDKLTALLGKDVQFAVLRPLSLVEYGTVNLPYDGYYAFAEHIHCTFAAPYDGQESDLVVFGRVENRRVIDIEFTESVPRGNPEEAVPESRKKLVKLYSEGLSYTQIALRLGVDTNFVNSTFGELRRQFFVDSSYDVCRLLGYKCDKNRYALRLSATQERKLLKLYHEGCKRAFICKNLGITADQYNAAKARIFRRYDVTSLKAAWNKIA